MLDIESEVRHSVKVFGIRVGSGFRDAAFAKRVRAALVFKCGVDERHQFCRSTTVGTPFALTSRRIPLGDGIDVDGPISGIGDAEVHATLDEAARVLLI